MLQDIVQIGLIHINIVIELFTTNKLPKKFSGQNHMIGRMMLCLQVVERIPQLLELEDWHDLLQYSIENYENPKKEIRDLSH